MNATVACLTEVRQSGNTGRKKEKKRKEVGKHKTVNTQCPLIHKLYKLGQSIPNSKWASKILSERMDV